MHRADKLPEVEPADLRFFEHLARKVEPELDLSLKSGIVTLTMRYRERWQRPCFTPALLDALCLVHGELRKRFEPRVATRERMPFRYLLLKSAHPTIFNLGGDLEFFHECIERQDVEQMRRYAHTCVRLVYSNFVALDLPVITAVLVPGDALGGGFETVVTHQIIVATEYAHFGCPEPRFWTWPFAGGYPLLARMLGPIAAVRWLLKGRVVTARDFYRQTGECVPDVVVGTREDLEEEFLKFIRRHSSATNAELWRMSRTYFPIQEADLLHDADVWVEHMLALPDEARDRMQRVIALSRA